MDPILRVGRNCWRIEKAHRLAFLVDAGPYFAAFRDAVRRSRHALYILGWDFDSRVELRRGRYRPEDGGADDLPERLGPFLEALLRRRSSLTASVLLWDAAVVYAFEREPLQRFELGWASHPRLHFRLDSSHASGAAHHEKFVVVDDALAFVGGIDLTRNRWDTPDHAVEHPERVDPGGHGFGPYHDVQVVLDGPAAAALGERARERWHRVGGEALDPPRERPKDAPWPHGVTPDFTDVDVAFARTDRPGAGRPGAGEAVREVEQLYLDAIAAAQRSIYLENQYLTSRTVVDALASRLREPDGPAVVVVLPRRASGWIEEATISALQTRALDTIREADAGGRFGVYYPGVDDDTAVYVHAKVAVFDDRLLRVGSANLTNRSMTIDTECDVAIEAAPSDARARRAITSLRNRWLAHLLGLPESDVEAALTAHGGDLHAAVEVLRERGRLVPLEVSAPAGQERQLADLALADPVEPVDARAVVRHFVPDEARPSTRRRVLRIVAVLAAFFAVVAVWRLTPLREVVQADAIASWLERQADDPWAVPLVLGVFAFGGSLGIPITVLITATAMAFAPLPGAVLAFVGALLAALGGYGLGALVGRGGVARVAGERAGRLARWLARRGLVTMIAVRIVPVAPYVVVNVVAGAVRVRPRDFLLGTVIGMLPGIVALTLFVDSLWAAVRDPSIEGIAIAGVILVAAVVLGALTRRWIAGRRSRQEGAPG